MAFPGSNQFNLMLTATQYQQLVAKGADLLISGATRDSLWRGVWFNDSLWRSV